MTFVGRKTFAASPPVQSLRITPGGFWLLSEATSPSSVGIYAYTSPPDKMSDYLYRPPQSAWTAVTMNSSGLMPGSERLGMLHVPTVKCFGSLADTSGDVAVTNPTNIQLLLQRPVTTCIIAALLYYGYYLWSHNIPVESVAYSYEAVVGRKELYRTVTASIAHFDLMHIGFK
jgi:hypothetical protein